MSKPRILILDVETSPARSYHWRCYRENIGVEQIIEPSRVISAAWKWYGESTVHFVSEFHDGHADMANKLWDVMDKADVLVGYNSAAFDRKMMNSMFLAAGMNPPSPSADEDLLRTVRRNFKEMSNKLTYITRKLDIGSKVKHHGFELWRDCMAGDKKAWALMKRYNKHDVKLTAELFELLRPWSTLQVNFGLYTEDAEDGVVCPKCGSLDLTQVNDYHTKTQTYDQFQCNECSYYARSRTRNRKQPDGVLK
jgi:hypothetical protein